MEERTLEVVRDLFRRYYWGLDLRREVPPDFARREFALQPLGREGMVRHLSFETPEELRKYITTKVVPAHLYYSTALYENPSAPDMDAKGWLGAELVIDIDVDHIWTPCKTQHDRWQCESCGATGTGPHPDQCPHCGGRKFRQETWICEQCLEVAKEEVLKVLEVLTTDLGVPEDKITVYFSGHRGFHIHVYWSPLLTLTAEERRELVDYLKLTGLDLTPYFEKRGRFTYTRLHLRLPGQVGRVVRSVYELALEKSTVAARELIEVLEGRRERITKRARDLLTELLPQAIARVRCEVDEKVMIDVHRLIRYPNSLHGKTGLRVTRVPLSRVEDFSVEEAIVFRRGTLRIRLTRKLPQDHVLGYSLGTVEPESKIEVPTYVALYVVCRGYGEVAE